MREMKKRRRKLPQVEGSSKRSSLKQGKMGIIGRQGFFYAETVNSSSLLRGKEERSYHVVFLIEKGGQEEI